MEPFKLTPQSITFLALMAAVAVVVAVAAPFGSIALSAVALAAIGVVLMKAMLRTRRWWPLTAVEGTVALSGLVLVVGGMAVVAYSIVRLGTGEPLRMMIGWPLMAEGPRAGVNSRKGRRNAHFPDAEMHKQFTDWLAKKGIEHELVKSHGQDYVVWDESKGDVVKEFMESRGGAECKNQVAAGKSAPGRC